MNGRKPQPTAVRRANGNPGKRGYNHDEPVPPEGLPDCPDHLTDVARAEWHRIAPDLHQMGVLTRVDRAALAAYCQAYARWVEAERKLQQTPPMVRTPSGYVQQSPWMSVANKQLEVMGRYMAELGITPASRTRVKRDAGIASGGALTMRVIYTAPDGTSHDADGRPVTEDVRSDVDIIDAFGPTSS